MLFGLFILAISLAYTPAFNAAISSADRLYQIIDRQPEIQSPDVIPNEYMVPKNNIAGLTFRNIEFSYPTRRDHKVLRSFHLDVFQGQTVALVGASGSGKSTCIQLLLRYYDPNSGKIVSHLCFMPFVSLSQYMHIYFLYIAY